MKAERFTALKFCGFLIAVLGFQVFVEPDLGFNASSSPWWKFFTSFVAHSGPEHLLNNLFFLGLFGSLYEGMTSGRTFLATFFVSAVFANLTAFIFFPETVIIGASGGAFGIMAALAVYRPNSLGLAMGVPVPMWAAFLLYLGIQLAGLTASNFTAYEAHLFGMVSGSIIGLYLHEDKDSSDDEDLEEENWRDRVREWEEKYML